MSEAVALSNDEYTVLMIAAEGHSMMPVGRWEEPVKRLVQLGYLWAQDKFNCTITEKGREALKIHEAALDLDSAKFLHGWPAHEGRYHPSPAWR